MAIKSQKLSTTSKVGVFAASLFVATIATYIYSPVIGSYAGSKSNVDVNIGEILAMSVSSDILGLDATINTFAHGAIDINVSTNNVFGYTISIEDVDDDTSLVHTDADISDEVTSTFEGAKTSDTMDGNTWGFSIDGIDYYSIPVMGDPVALKRTTSANATAFETTSVDFGVKVGQYLTSGTYTDTVKLTAYVNGQDRKPREANPRNVDGTEYSYNACLDAKYVLNDVLTDPRDGETYTVKSLKDGQCWMTQNLRIANKTIDSTDSDLPAGMSYTIPVATNSNSGSYDTGSAMRAIWTDSQHVAHDFGVLYNYYTATAGTGGTDVSSGTAAASICPKGWRLPYNAAEFDNLAALYEGSVLDVQDSEVNLTRHGVARGGSWIEINSHGAYWTATITSSDKAEYYNRGNTLPLTYDRYGKSVGNAVRCIAK